MGNTAKAIVMGVAITVASMVIYHHLVAPMLNKE
jgi:hypothetical protein